jgi:putative glutamine amidotransferase
MPSSGCWIIGRYATLALRTPESLAGRIFLAVTERVRPREVVWPREQVAVDHHGLMTRPLIGITSEMAAAGWGDRVREAVLLPASYARAVERSGCVPVLLPAAPYHAADLAAGLDAVVFSDGADVGAGPGGAGQQDGTGACDAARDASEFALMRAAILAGLPVLAIGRGMRVLNTVRGGSLTDRPDADGASPQPVTWVARNVRLSPDSRLGRLLGPSLTAPFADVPGGRQQMVDRLGNGVTAVAWADGESIEAIEIAGHPFALGVQWHPEQDEDMRIFDGLREAASSRSAAA